MKIERPEPLGTLWWYINYDLREIVERLSETEVVYKGFRHELCLESLSELRGASRVLHSSRMITSTDLDEVSTVLAMAREEIDAVAMGEPLFLTEE